MHPQPLTTFAALPSGGEGDGLLAAEKKINLDLRIGSYAGEGRVKRIVQEKGTSFFTNAQFHEFCRQIFIYNSIVHGFPLAFHLLIPIWMSVFNSSGPAICNPYPTFSGFSSEKFDHSSGMDSEPGRCKRTDGRKWRCSKNVVPLQKYCERHMHRGRQGSRKHVEPIERVSRHGSRTSDDSRMPVMSLVASTDVVDRASTSPCQPHSSYRSGYPGVLKCRDDETRHALFAMQNTIGSCNIGDGSNGVDYAGSTCSSSKSSFDNANPTSIRKQNVVGSNYVGFTSPRFGLSPNSVLIAAGKVGSGSGCTTIAEVEPRRCRRTDGKKWQCRQETLPNQKYCKAHMHRGAKRQGVSPHHSRNFQATPAWTVHTSSTITRNLDSGINLNTVPASPQHVSDNSSSSDATTISDENINFCLSQLSPQ